MNVLRLTDESFEAEVLKADEPVLVIFTARWCGPCKILDKGVTAMDEPRHVKVCSIDTDDYRPLARNHGVRRVPTMIVFRDGVAVKKSVGYNGMQGLNNILAAAAEGQVQL